MKLKEIAELAGVSPATVSLVLNNRSGVSDSTRACVEELLCHTDMRCVAKKIYDMTKEIFYLFDSWFRSFI